jgi:glycosyltransferase involved in cell wall biosynthesis
VGDGELREELRQLAATLGVSDRCHFVGFQTDPAPFYDAMDVFALTSRSEGMPLAVLEAWAAGLPVVASRVGGVPELVNPGVNGLMFEGDDEGALTAALRDLLSDPAMARRLGDAGRLLAESSYSLRRMAEEYQRHYLELLSSSSGVRPSSNVHPTAGGLCEKQR